MSWVQSLCQTPRSRSGACFHSHIVVTSGVDKYGSHAVSSAVLFVLICFTTATNSFWAKPVLCCISLCIAGCSTTSRLHSTNVGESNETHSMHRSALWRSPCLFSGLEMKVIHESVSVLSVTASAVTVYSKTVVVLMRLIRWCKQVQRRTSTCGHANHQCKTMCQSGSLPDEHQQPKTAAMLCPQEFFWGTHTQRNWVLSKYVLLFAPSLPPLEGFLLCQTAWR